MNKLWDKGIKLNKKVEEFTIGSDQTIDLCLAKWDIIGSMAHAVMLNQVGLLSNKEVKSLLQVLDSLYKRAIDNKLNIGPGVEDIHSQIEIELTKELGDTGKKIHTGRSRNDQILVDIRLFYRDEIARIAKLVTRLSTLLLEKAEKYKDTLMPGYTHMQIAMVSSFGLWFASWAESLSNDLIILQSARRLNNHNPLGTAAGYGTNLPVNREITTDLLEFEEMNVISSYAQFSRVKSDLALANAIAAIGFTLSKMSSDLVLFTGQNFSFFSLDDEFTTGSSIMPQKKNPDILEIIRGRCNRLQALPGEISLMQVNLNSGYHRDMQLLKETVLPSIQTIKECLSITTMVIENINVNPDLLNDEKYQPLLSTNKVNDLVKKGMPFREAYQQVGDQIGKINFNHPDITGYTHQGSIGNLCLEKIRSRIETLLPELSSPEADQLAAKILNYLNY
ncbi:MAG: argininosuccinate lyase [Bacteroidales bacterium]|nr:argininosuccinate lyase [Bacteroidales bacterium]